MAFELSQTLNFENPQYHYDRTADVLYLSFGPPVPGVALQVEDWLALRLSLGPPPRLAGMTIVGFKRIFEKINRYIEQELPERVERLRSVRLKISYDDLSDTLIMRSEEPGTLSIFERLRNNVYLEISLPSKEVMGLKIVDYTKRGPAAIEDLFGAIIDTLFEPQASRDESAHLVTSAVIRHIDWNKLASVPA